jgi:hypothetical protein
MEKGTVRDVFYQGLNYANKTAQDCIDRGYQVWIEKRHCIDGRLAKPVTNAVAASTPNNRCKLFEKDVK